MNTSVLIQKLNALLAYETRSLVHHLDDGRPYLTAETYPIWVQVERAMAVSSDHAQRVTRMIAKSGEETSTSTFESVVANYHYLTLTEMLPHLIDEKKSQIDAIKSLLTEPGLDRAMIDELQSLLGDHQTILREIEAGLKSSDG